MYFMRIMYCQLSVSIPTNDIIEKMRKSSQLHPKAHEKISKSVIEKDSILIFSFII